MTSSHDQIINCKSCNNDAGNMVLSEDLTDMNDAYLLYEYEIERKPFPHGTGRTGTHIGCAFFHSNDRVLNY